MNVHLEPTGERVLEDSYQQSLGKYTIYAMHAASYRFVEPLCAGKKVLDLGCGSGYGTHRISGVAEVAHGMDVASDAIAYAKALYESENLHFLQVEAGSPLPFVDASFDVILSFQVIEHVNDDDAYLREARRLLKPGGTLVVITPDRKNRLLPGQKPWNRWHLREYAMADLANLIGKHFRVVNQLRMGADWPIAATEIKRYTRTKWLALPATLPFVPEFLRQWALNLIHTLIDRAKSAEPPAVTRDYGFDESDFLIEENPPHSMNLIVVARRLGDEPTV